MWVKVGILLVLFKYQPLQKHLDHLMVLVAVPAVEVGYIQGPWMPLVSRAGGQHCK
jgi:hypothetical protein